MSSQSNRREFLKMTGASLAAAALARSVHADDKPAGKDAGPWLKKAVKYDMIRLDKGSIEEKLNLAKDCGFLGVETNSPSNLNIEEAVKARDKTGVVIHGIIDSIHWNVRLSDPKPEVRAKGLEALVGALNDAKALGADTVLLVPGKVADKEKENYDQVWERSTAEVKKAIPTAEKNNVRIAIEVVWNDFITKPEQLVQYVDQFNNPIVGAYFDVSNMVKYGVPSADWIRKLGRRMLKFDFKGYSKTKQWVAIGEGDEDWPEVLKALKEVGYHGWATAEVGDGGKDHLTQISKQMDKVLGLG